ncbi:MAG: EAL domain-containing protein [Dokdonella sp.]|uniref:EAL domain-containing protein n=1 Tax=Dokdonella sp. TaxID=2291710 RepID=UPI0032677615
MAFQPIVDLSAQDVFAYEALVRFAGGDNAAEVLRRVQPEQLYRFDQRCRVVAIETAAALDMRERLSINFLPQAVYEPAACIRLTLEAAVRAGFSTEKLIFEFTENEPIRDPAHTLDIVRYYRTRHMMTAFDDFGAGYAGLGLLVDFQPDLVKLDMHLIRGIEASVPRQHVVAAVVGLCEKLSVRVVAEGVETADELDVLATLGISLFQGYYVARPQLEALPTINPAVWHVRTRP